MADEVGLVSKLAEALRGLPELERDVFLAMLDERATYPVIAARLKIDAAEAERAFAAALVRLTGEVAAPSRRDWVGQSLSSVAVTVRLAWRRLRR